MVSSHTISQYSQGSWSWRCRGEDSRGRCRRRRGSPTWCWARSSRSQWSCGQTLPRSHCQWLKQVLGLQGGQIDWMQQTTLLIIIHYEDLISSDWELVTNTNIAIFTAYCNDSRTYHQSSTSPQRVPQSGRVLGDSSAPADCWEPQASQRRENTLLQPPPSSNSPPGEFQFCRILWIPPHLREQILVTILTLEIFPVRHRGYSQNEGTQNRNFAEHVMLLV